LLSEPASVFEILDAQPGEPLLQQRLMTRAAELAGECPAIGLAHPLRRFTRLVLS
jgi:hypothetical protein